jgi:rubrerythrin
MSDDTGCTICGEELEEKEIEDDKVKRLKKNNKHLGGEDIHKLVCTECGHTAYVIKD